MRGAPQRIIVKEGVKRKMEEMENTDLERLARILLDGLKYGYLQDAVMAVGILSRYVEELVKEQEILQETERRIRGVKNG